MILKKKKSTRLVIILTYTSFCEDAVSVLMEFPIVGRFTFSVFEERLVKGSFKLSS